MNLRGRRRIANSPAEMAVAAIAAVITIGGIARKAVKDSRRYRDEKKDHYQNDDRLR